ncbi:MAG: hypothetical protein ABIH47_00330, partial [Candidatus Omnitrophota bacterium]
MMINGKVQPEGNSNREIDDIQREVAAVMKPSTDKFKSPAIDLSASPKEAAKGGNPASGGISKAPELKNDDVMKGTIPGEPKLGTGDAPTKTGTTTATCSACSCKISGTLDEFTKVQEEFGTIYCPLCIENADGKPQPVKPSEPKVEVKPSKPVVIRACKTCGIELSGARALECYQKDKPFTCEECESTQEEAAPIKPLPTTPARQPDARIPVQAYTPQGSIIKGFQPSLKEIGKIKIGGKGEERQKAGGGTFR